MTREEAIRRIKAWNLDSDDMEVLSAVIPEFAESEDERIRKIITDSVFYQYGAGDEYNDVLDYFDKLEKQKEQMSVEYLDKDKVYAIMKKLHKLAFSQLIPINSDEFKKIDEITSDVRKLLDYPIKKKPVDNVSREEYVKTFKVLCDAYEIKLPNREYDIYHLCDDLAKLSMDSGKQKSVEWSDDVIRKAVKEVGLTQHQIDWFKTNVFPPKQKWSKEDEEMFELLHTCVCRCINDDRLDYAEREQISKKIIPFIENLKNE